MTPKNHSKFHSINYTKSLFYAVLNNHLHLPDTCQNPMLECIFDHDEVRERPFDWGGGARGGGGGQEDVFEPGYFFVCNAILSFY